MKSKILRRNIIWTLSLILLASSLVGCSDIKEENTQEYNYVIDETDLPNQKNGIEISEGGKITRQDPCLCRNYVYTTSVTYDKSYCIDEMYTQILNLGQLEWTNHKVINSAFSESGRSYDGINSDIYPSLDGTLYTSAYINEGDIYLAQISETGIGQIVCECTDEFEKEIENLSDESFIIKGKDNNFYSNAINNGIINSYDQNLKKIDSYEIDGQAAGLLQANKESDLLWYGNNAAGKATIRKLKTGEIVIDEVKELASDFKAVVTADEKIFLADTQNLWELVDGHVQKIYEFPKTGYVINELYGMEVEESGEIILLVKLDGNNTLLRMKKTDKPYTKKELVLAFYTPHLGLNKSIDRFNRKNHEYYVTVLLPEDDESQDDFCKRIAIELATENGPDILGEDIITDINSYIQNGYIEPVDDIFDDTSRYLKAAIEESKVDGKLYGIPYECKFDTVAYAKEDVGNANTWTLSDFMEAFNSSGADSLQEDINGIYIIEKYVLYDNSNTDFIDWNNGVSHLNEQPFIELLEFAKSYDNVQSTIDKVFAYDVLGSFTGLEKLKEFYTNIGGDFSVFGYPRAQGNGIYVDAETLYLNASSEDKTGVKEFFTYLISDEEQIKYITYNVYEQMREEGIESLSGQINYFPISLAANDALVEMELEKDKNNIEYTDSGVKQFDIMYTEEMIEQFYFILENAQPIPKETATIFNMVEEELAPYFAGEMSADEAAQKLNSRVQLYFDEKK